MRVEKVVLLVLLVVLLLLVIRGRRGRRGIRGRGSSEGYSMHFSGIHRNTDTGCLVCLSDCLIGRFSSI